MRCQFRHDVPQATNLPSTAVDIDEEWVIQWGDSMDISHSDGSVGWAGACAYFDMDNGWGQQTVGRSCQMSANSHRSLQLPFILFGLGRTPNFVNTVSGGVIRILLCSVDITSWYYGRDVRSTTDCAEHEIDSDEE